MSKYKRICIPEGEDAKKFSKKFSTLFANSSGQGKGARIQGISPDDSYQGVLSVQLKGEMTGGQAKYLGRYEL